LPLNFTYEISQAGYFAFIDIDARVFKRTLSNLINNAVDAQDKKIGKINIHLEVIKDKILNNIAITFGKPVGNGLGFSQIREALYNNGGELSIESELG
jgi:signal transduction histidine kinase